MRKILVLFALMTVVVGAWAQKVTTYYDGDQYCGMYWTATHGVKVEGPTYERYADAILLTASKRRFNPGYRHPGYSIRPVFTKPITQ